VLGFQIFFNEIALEKIYLDMLNTLHLRDPALYNPELQDITRKVWNESALVALSEDNFYWLFGWGLRTGGYIVAPYAYDLFTLAGVQTTSYRENIGTPGFAALALDSGVIGLSLLAMVTFYCILEIWHTRKKLELFLLFGPVAFIIQLFIMNIFDVILFYIALMPGGFFFTLSKCNLESHSLVEGETKLSRAGQGDQVV
jgi:hypothetical protein